MSKVKMISPAVPNVPWQDKPEGHTGAPVWRYSVYPNSQQHVQEVYTQIRRLFEMNKRGL